jgi:omega-6 fatty acid desaturase (delta-12 desaturase)
MSPLGNSLVAWQITHDHHHRYTQLRGQEVDWSANLRTRADLRSPSRRHAPLVRLGYRLPLGIFIWIGWNTLRRAVDVRSMTSGEWQAWRTPLRRSNLSMFGSVVLIYGGLWMWVGFWDMLRYHGVPAAIAMLTGSFIITIQHANSQSLIYAARAWDPARSQMASTFDVRFPRWVEYLWCNINIHVPHHVAPEIPWYHLPESARLLSAALPGCYLESRFGVEHLRFFWRAPFLRPVEGKGYFILDSAGGA